MDIERHKLLSWWAMIRWFLVVVLFSIGLLHISFKETVVQNIIFFGVFAGIVALNFMFQIQANRTKNWVIVFQIVLDIVFATLIVHITGGLGSFFVWAYLIGVITAALTTPQHGGLIAGVTGSFALLILVLLYRNGVLVPTEGLALDISGATVYVLSYTGLFCGVALIANYLSDQLANHRDVQAKFEQLKIDSEAQQARLHLLEEMIPALRDIAHLDHDINTPLCVITLSLGRVKRYASEYQNEGLNKTNNEITDAVNKISLILQRLQALKESPLIGYKQGSRTPTNIPSTNEQIAMVKSPYTQSNIAKQKTEEDNHENKEKA